MANPILAEIWLGLNDIAEEGNYQWIDGSPFSMEEFNMFSGSFPAEDSALARTM